MDVTHLRTVEAHQSEILAAVRPLETRRLALAEALGRTLTRAVPAAVDIPVFDNSAMDGFAVRAADVAAATADQPVALRVVADLPAGTALDPRIGSGEAARIMTGAPLPRDADAIIPFEDTVAGLTASLERTLVTAAPRQPGVHIRRAGEDVRAGADVLPAGVALGPLQLAAAAAAGVDRVDVAAAPRVAVVSTGSELVPAGTPLRRGQIPESNAILLASLCTRAGAEVVVQTTVDDEGSGLERLLAELTSTRAVDVVVFTGGVSAGAYEVVKSTLAGVMAFTKVAMQPGKPQGFGCTEDGVLLFGLPGNPVSAAVSFEVFVRPALLALQHRRALHRPVLRLPAAADWRTPPGRRQYLPVVLERDADPWRARPATTGGSHLAGGLGRGEAYAVVPADTAEVRAGDIVDVMLTGE